ncbi:hypothetical protein QCA50_020887 [Cerrena zonata]|uniref:Uncharacterized protein n=1 Tax=Cerrena zonata TaxID=2478898 RepID=A0AAW0F8U1_9APHY
MRNIVPPRLSEDPHKTSQSITISGLGSKQFDQFHSAIQSIAKVFYDHGYTPMHNLNLESVSSSVNDMLTFSNDYFTHLAYRGNGDQVPFPVEVDPCGILGDFLKYRYQDGTHTSDNEVHYFERFDDAGDGYYVRINPDNIRPRSLGRDFKATFGSDALNARVS